MADVFANIASTLTNEQPAIVAEKPVKGNGKKKGDAKPEIITQTTPEVNSNVTSIALQVIHGVGNNAPVDKPVHLVANVKKADQARAIFNGYLATGNFPQRKDIIARFVSECGLTQNGAATYLQNFKKAAGLVATK